MHAIFTTADHLLFMEQLKLKSCTTKSFRLWLWLVTVNIARALTVSWQIVLQAKRTSVLKEDTSRKTRNFKKKKVRTCKKLYYGNDLGYPELGSYSHRCGLTVLCRSLQPTSISTSCHLMWMRDKPAVPPFPFPPLFLLAPWVLFKHRQGFLWTMLSQGYRKGTGPHAKPIIAKNLPHWESVGVCNNNLRTHCFLGETHHDGILDKWQNSQGSWTPAISYPWKMNGHSKATGN